VQSSLEPSIPDRASPVVANHVVGRPVQPDQRRIAIRDIANATPRHEKDLGDRVIDGVTLQASAAISVDRSIAPAIQLAKPRVLARGVQRNRFRPAAHDIYMLRST
jgi:hypothetical protein